jgi:hypothetical protein
LQRTVREQGNRMEQAAGSCEGARMNIASSTVGSCRRNYLRRMHRLGIFELDSIRNQILREALDKPKPIPKTFRTGWSNCRLCDLEYKVLGHRFLKGYAIVRCPSCRVWQRPRV